MSRIPRLLVVTTHPVQYMAPWYRGLAQDPDLRLDVVFFRELDPQSQGVGFGQAFQWDVPLREGYASHVINAPSGIRGLARLLWRLRQVARQVRPNAVLLTGWNELGLIAAYPLLRLMGLPLIARGESNDLRRRSRMVRVLHRQLLRFVSAAVVIGKSNAQFYLANGVPSGRLFPGAYFVESERIVTMAEQFAARRAALRDQAGFADEDFVFCFVGKHVAFKRPLLLVEAAAMARQRGWPVKLLFAGSGELTEQILQRSNKLAVPVFFTGFLNQTELWRAYVPSDAFVLPSTSRETWGLVTNEAMLFGLPVIVSDQVGCSPDLVREGVTGFTFAGEAEGLLAAMEKLLAGRDRVKDMGLAGQQLVLEEYSMPVATEGLKAALRAVCR